MVATAQLLTFTPRTHRAAVELALSGCAPDGSYWRGRSEGPRRPLLTLLGLPPGLMRLERACGNASQGRLTRGRTSGGDTHRGCAPEPPRHQNAARGLSVRGGGSQRAVVVPPGRPLVFVAAHSQYGQLHSQCVRHGASDHPALRSAAVESQLQRVLQLKVLLLCRLLLPTGG